MWATFKSRSGGPLHRRRKHRRQRVEVLESRRMLAGDLVVESITAPSTILAGNGESITVDWVVRNMGADPTDQPIWFDAIYLSNDDQLDGFDRLVGAKGTPPSVPVAAGAVYSESLTFEVPSFEPGNKFLLVVANDFGDLSESDTSNNVLAQAVTINVPNVDLEVDEVTAPPFAVAGQPFQFNYELVLGTGSDQALASRTDKVYLSSDNVIDPSDAILSELRIESPQFTTGGSTELTLPGGTPLGDYHLIVQLDFFDEQYETNAFNQAGFFFPFTVTDTAPDLTVTSVTAPSSAVLGEEITVEWTVENQGSTTAGLLGRDAIYLSTDMVLDDNDIRIAEEFVTDANPLAVGANYSRTRNISLTAGDPSHAFLLVATDNPFNNQPEEDESNNVLAHAISLAAPDLEITSFTAPSTGVLGQTVSVDLELVNHGPAEVPDNPNRSIVYSFYLSDDNTFDSSDTLIDSHLAIDTFPLAAAGTDTLAVDVDLSGGPHGLVYLLAVVDGTNMQPETDESNNVAAAMIDISGPDLVFVDSTSPAFAEAGDTITVEWRVENHDFEDAAGSWFDSIYLSTDSQFDFGDTFLGDIDQSANSPIPAIDGGGVASGYDAQLDVTLPLGTAPGNYFLLIQTDVYNFSALGIPETFEDNNLLAIPIAVSIPPLPDLVPTELIAPATAVLGSTTTVDYTVENQGGAAAVEESWSDDFYLSSDAVFDEFTDTYLDTSFVDNFDGIDPGEDYTLSIDLTFFEGDLGNMFLLVVADQSDDQPEDNETNNVLAVPIETVASNLTISNPVAPANALASGAVHVEFDVTNNSAFDAGAFWNDSVILSNDPVLGGGDDLLLGNFSPPVSPLLPGQDYTATFDFNLPADTPIGTNYLILVTDFFLEQPETDETDNRIVLPIEIAGPDTNLQVTSFVSNTASTLPGTGISVSHEVTNFGTDPAEANWTDRIYLSNDDVLDGSDRSLRSIGTSAFTPLAGGASYDLVDTFVFIPDDVVPANYFLIVSADDTNQQAETDNSDNTLAIPFTVNAAGVDLVIDNFTGPATAYVGEEINVSWTVINQGPNAAMGTWSDLLSLANDDPPTLLQSIGVQNFNQSAPYTVNGTFTIPASFDGFEVQFLHLEIDSGDRLIEEDETNNIATLPIVVSAPDLEITAINIPAMISPGEEITVEWTVTNNESVPAVAPRQDYFYLSHDSQLDAGDESLIFFPPAETEPIPAGGSVVFSRTVTIPSTASGSRFLIVNTDQNNQQAETNENNNAFAQPVTVANIDLVVEALNVPVANAQFGDTFDVTFSVRNQGNSPTTQTWSDGIYLVGGTLGERLLAQRSADGETPLAANGSYEVTLPVTLPIDIETTTGTYAIEVRTDFTRAQNETNDANNAASASVDLTLPPLPDLIVSEINGPIEGFRSQQFTLDWTVSNQGSAAASGQWIDRVYFSTDQTLGPEDLLMGEFPFDAEIPAGESIQRIQNLTFPEVDGTFHVIVVTDGDGTLPEGPADGNNITVDDTSFPLTTPPRPDLVVTSITPPPNGVMTGQTVTFTYEVTNQGTAPTPTPFWIDGYFLAQDPNITITQPALIGTIENLPWIRVFRDRSEHAGFGAQPRRAINPTILGPGESYQQTIEVPLLDGIGGPWYVYVSTDMFRFPKPGNTEGFVSESDGANNLAVSSAFNVTLTPPPDLQVTNVVAPSQAFSGQPIEIAWTVTNEGTGGTPGDRWVDAVYLSTDDQLDGSDTLLGNFTRNGSLDVAASYLTSQVVTLPQGISGDFTFLVVTDTSNVVFEHVFEDNNLGAETSITQVLLTPPPDLELINVTAPSSALASHTINLTYEVANNGSTDISINRWTDAIYLSTDDVFSPATDMRIGELPAFGPRNVGQTLTATVPVVLPDGIAGDFFLFVVADDLNQVFEVDNDNNVSLSGAIAIESRPADLIISAANVPLNPIAGQATAISWTTTNQGIGATAVAGWRDTIYLSTDDTLDGGDLRVASFDYTGMLAENASVVRNEVITLPFHLSGTYRLFIETDAPNLPLFPAGQIFEDTAEGNNLHGPIVINVVRQTADLTVSGIAIPAVIEAGDTITVDWTVENIGPAATNTSYWYDDLYLSSNLTAGDADDIYLGSHYRNNGLAPSGQYSASITTMLPNELATGEYYVMVRTDRPEPRFAFDGPVNRVLEDPTEDNNSVFSEVRSITQPATSDLAVTQVDAPSSSFSGQFFNVTWTVENQGEATAARNWVDAVYLSFDQVFDPATDAYLGFVERTTDLPVGQSYTESASFQIPVTMSGPLYVFVQTDQRDEVYESGRELNNAALDPVSMNAGSLAPVDLVAGTITVPATAQPGDSVTIDYTVNNSGTNPALGSWFDTLYLSVNDQWDLSDPVLGTVFHQGDVPGGGNYSESLTANLPGVLPGEYHVIVRSDIRGQIAETDETNNIGASLDRTLIDIPALTLGAITSGSLVAGQSRFFQVTAAADDTLRFLLDTQDDSAATELQVSFDRVPTRQNADFQFEEPFAADHEIVVPSAEAGIYYVLVYGDQISGATNFDILAEVIPFSVTSVSPNEAGNAGSSTLKIRGARFDRNTQFELAGSGTPIAASSVQVQDSSTAFVTFDLNGAAIESYDVLARNSVGGEVSLVEGLEVVAGFGAVLRTNITVPERTVVGRGGTVTVTYGNEGDSDLPAPLLVVHSPTTTLVGLDPEFVTPGSNIRFLATSTEGPAGVVRPGQFETIPISFVAPDQAGDIYTFDLGFYDTANTEPLDIDLVLGQLSDSEFRSQSDWPVVRAELLNRLGSTWGQYVTALSTAASLLPPELGDPRDPVDLLHIIARQAQAAVGTSISGAVRSSDHMAKLGGKTVSAYDASQRSVFLTTTLNDGTFAFPRVIPGNFDIEVVDTVSDLLNVDVSFGESLTGLEVPFENGLAISGTIATANNVPVENASIQVIGDNGVSRQGVSDANGFYSIPGLEPGNYRLEANADGLGRTIVAGLELLNADLQRNVVLETDAEIRGSIAFGVEGPGDTPILIFAEPSDLSDGFTSYGAVTDGANYSITGLPPGSYDIVFLRDGYVRQEVADITVLQGETVDLPQTALAAAASISGSVESSDAQLIAANAYVGAFEGDTLVSATQANEQGLFTLANIPAGTYSIRSLDSARFFQPPEVKVVAGETLTGVKLQIVPGARIVGVVSEPVSQHRFAGASVQLITPNGEVSTTTTDDSGQYEFSGLGLGSYSISLTGADAAAAVPAEVTDVKGQLIEVPLEFTPNIRLSGQLTNSTNEPLPGLVNLYLNDQHVGVSSADESGNYSFLVNQAGTYDLLATSPRGVFQRLNGVVLADNDSIVQDLVSGQQLLEVTATDAVQSIEGATAFLFFDTPGLQQPLAFQSFDETGTLEFANLLPGNYRVEIVGDNSRYGSGQILVEAGTPAQVAIVLDTRPVFSGSVTTSTADPISDAVVVIYESGSSTPAYSLATLDDGTFELTHVRPGNYDLIVFADGFASRLVTSVSITTDAQQDVTLQSSTATASGQLIDQFGQPVDFAPVRVYDVGGRVIDEAISDVTGQFVIDSATGSDLRLVVSHEGFAPAEVAGVDIASGQTVDLGQVNLTGVSLAASLVPPPISSGKGEVASNIKAPLLSNIAFLIKTKSKGRAFLDTFDGSDDLKEKDVQELPDCSACGGERSLVLAHIRLTKLALENARDTSQQLVDRSNDALLTGVKEAAKAAAALASLIVAFDTVGIAVAGMETGLLFGAETAAAKALIDSAGLLGFTKALLDLDKEFKEFVARGGAAKEGEDALTAFQNAISTSENIIDVAQNLSQALADVAKAGKLFEASSGLHKFLKGFAPIKIVIDFAVTLFTNPFMETNSRIQDVINLEKNFDQVEKKYIELRNETFAKNEDYQRCLQNDAADAAKRCECQNGNCGGDNNNSGSPGGAGGGGSGSGTSSAALDPNDIIGPAGFGDQRWLAPISSLEYMIRFENVATATAPAQVVTLTHQLDDDLDFRSFRVDDFGFGGFRQEAPGDRPFLQERLDFSATTGFFVDVTATIDVQTGIASWTFKTIDPATGDAPENGLTGFLPPNVADGIGEGFVTFSVTPKSGIATGDTIDALATIIFDTQPPLDTPLWRNTIDRDLPTSSVTALPFSSPTDTFHVEWFGSDAPGGSGLADFTVFVAENDGPFRPWLEQTTLTTAPFIGERGNRYRFYSVAHDNAGNTEAAPSIADATIALADIVGRHLFYNNSFFDGNDPAASSADDAAIAIDKLPLLPGETAGFENFTSFASGINGLFIDLAGLPATSTLTPNDFEFRIGNDNAPTSWPVLSTAPRIDIRRGDGESGSDRISLIWPDGELTGTWLQVTVKASANTGLLDDDTFYFGNLPGEIGGNSVGLVDAIDFVGTRANSRDAVDSDAILSRYDHNRDGLVDSDDLVIVRDHATRIADLLRLITPTSTIGKQANNSGGKLNASFSTIGDHLFANDLPSFSLESKPDEPNESEPDNIDNAINAVLAEYSLRSRLVEEYLITSEKSNSDLDVWDNIFATT